MNVRDNEVFTPIDLINAKHYHQLSTLSLVTSCLNLWIKRIHLAEITPREDYLHLDQVDFRERADLRYVTFTIHTTDVYVQLKHQRTKHWFDFISGVYAKVNGMGFIETPYRKVTNGVDLESTPIT
jgi:DNA-directed RNA polymerase subunit beta